MQPKNHWESVYASTSSTRVSWYQEHADLSLRLIEASGVPRAGAIVDVGGGASTLVDDLLDLGYSDLTVLDLSAAALGAAQARLGPRAGAVRWIEADITGVELPPRSFDLWHDRAVFHFLTDPGARHRYVQAVMRAVKPGGHVIVGTFAEDGPEQCSGLPVARYSPRGLHAEFGDAFELLHHERESHLTPAGAAQRFVYCYCRLRPS